MQRDLKLCAARVQPSPCKCSITCKLHVRASVLLAVPPSSAAGKAQAVEVPCCLWQSMLACMIPRPPRPWLMGTMSRPAWGSFGSQLNLSKYKTASWPESAV